MATYLSATTSNGRTFVQLSRPGVFTTFWIEFQFDWFDYESVVQANMGAGSLSDLLVDHAYFAQRRDTSEGRVRLNLVD